MIAAALHADQLLLLTAVPGILRKFPDPATLTADDSARIWNTQVTASHGFVDGDKEVYVNQDTQTIWV